MSTDPILPSRHFVSWAEPLLPQAARLLVAHYTRGGDTRFPEARMDRAVVVVPGARAGRRLKELLASAAERAGVRLVPPRIVTQGVAPELLYATPRPAAPGALSRLVWAQALAGMNRERLHVVFARLPEGRSPLDWTPLARELAALARTVAAGGYRFSAVADRVASGGLYNDTPRWRVLAAVQDRVEERLEELGFADPDLARISARDEGRVALDGDVWLVGVAETTRILREMILEAGQRGTGIHAVVHAAPGESPAARDRDFDLLGCIRADAWTGRHLPIPDDHIRVVDRPEDQAAEVARILAAVAEAAASGGGGTAGPPRGLAAEDIAIGVPSSEVIPALEQTLPQAGVPVRDAAGVSLSATGPYRLLAAVAAWAAERRYEELAALVRHPDLSPALEAGLNRSATDPGSEPRPGLEPGHRHWLTSLDRWYRAALPARIPSPFPEVGDSRDVLAARAVVNEVDALLADLEGSAELSTWVEPILRLLARVYTPLELSEARERDRITLRALEEIRWAAERLASLPTGLDVPCPAPRAIRFLLEEAASGHIPTPARDEAVELLGWLELHLDDAPVTVVTGVNEGSLPESVRGDPFLPDALRRLLGLEDNVQRHARDVYRMAAIWHSRESLYLVSGRRSSAGDPLRPSRILFATDDATVSERVRRFYGGGDQPPAHLPTAVDPGRPASGSKFILPPEPELPAAPLPPAISVTRFRTLLDDPWLWRLSETYRLDTLDDDLLEMDPLGFGTLAHDVLQIWGREEVVRQEGGRILTDPDEVWATLEPVLKRVVSARFGWDAAQARPAVRLQVAQLGSRLRAFAGWQADWSAQGWRIRAVETGTGGSDEGSDDGIPFPYGEEVGGGEVGGEDVGGERVGGGRGATTGPTIGLKARIDRVDVHPERGVWAVFDYKTSDRASDPDAAHREVKDDDVRWLDLQLPLYHWLVTRIRTGDGSSVIPPDPGGAQPEILLGYINLPRDLSRAGGVLADWSDTDVAEALEVARAALRRVDGVTLHFDPELRAAYPEPEMEALLGRSVLVGRNGAGPDDDGEDDG